MADYAAQALMQIGDLAEDFEATSAEVAHRD